MSESLDYEKLVAKIYRDLEPYAVITHDDKIKGAESNIERQIDVSIRTALAGHEILVIVQAKHMRRPADVNIVGEFKAVIEDVRASKGVLVCSSGFTEAALEYGRGLGIDLCSAVDAQNRKWSLDLKIPLVWVETDGEVEVGFELAPDRNNDNPLSVRTDLSKWKLSRNEDLPETTIGQYLADLWNEGKLDRTPKVDHSYDVIEKTLRVLLGDDFWCPIADMKVHYKTTRTGWLGAYSLRDCRGIFNHGRKTLVAKAVISSVDMPFVRDPTWPILEDPDLYFKSNSIWIMIEKRMAEDCFTFQALTGL
jgi:hypothetical protein